MKKTQPRIIVITGGTSGIGRALVEHFRASGDTVCNLARSCDPLTVGNFVCDVSDEARVREVMHVIGARYGRIDILINNAGYGVSGAYELLPSEQTRRNMDVNFFGTLYCSQAALPFMKKGAKIINISSACALFPLPFRGMYCSSKAAVSMLSYSMRMELADSGVTVVNVCPGDIKTEFTANRIKEVETNFRYGERVKRAAHKIDSRQDKRMDVSVVTKRIDRICKRKNPKPLWIIGAKYKVFYFLQRIVPTRVFNACIARFFGGY